MYLKSMISLALGASMLSTSVAFAGKSDLRAMLPLISEIKDQKGRNTCTIQTTIAMLESFYLKKSGQELDLSEEWIQYLASIANGSGGAKGSTVQTDVSNFLNWGTPTEKTLPYTRGEWKGSEPTAQKRCGHLSEGDKLTYTRCLYGKFPSSYLKTSSADLQNLPDGDLFAIARDEAKEVRALFSGVRPRIVGATTAKELLQAQIPIALEINLFHGSWNTQVAADKGMKRDLKLYKAGVVTFPEVGSIDRNVSPGMGSRHAVQIVGYDDDIEVSYTINMADGTPKTFTRKGVYFFKNSWGTKDFGSNFTYDKMKIRGFGMILQDHVHQFGKLTAFE